MESFKTEKEAQDRVDQLTVEPSAFCPLSRDGCRIDCVCYLGARLHKTVSLDSESKRVENFRVITGGCRNSMFFED